MSEDKWFKHNLSEVQGFEHPKIGKAYLFGESYPRELFGDYGVNIRVLEPDQPASLYHAESVDETFLVLGGECFALVEGEKVPLRKWDFLHCRPGVHHLLVGAGGGPCWILMIGGRKDDDSPHFPVDDAAAGYGASVARETSDPRDAWAQAGLSFEDFEPADFPWPPR
jgi:uncharacterized cupin superfamily protein